MIGKDARRRDRIVRMAERAVKNFSGCIKLQCEHGAADGLRGLGSTGIIPEQQAQRIVHGIAHTAVRFPFKGLRHKAGGRVIPATEMGDRFVDQQPCFGRKCRIQLHENSLRFQA